MDTRITLPPNVVTEVAKDVAEDWDKLTEQWRRGRASAPTRRDLAAALPQRSEALTDDALACDASEAVAGR